MARAFVPQGDAGEKLVTFTEVGDGLELHGGGRKPELGHDCR